MRNQSMFQILLALLSGIFLLAGANQIQATPPVKDILLFADPKTEMPLMYFGDFNHWIINSEGYSQEDPHRIAILKDIRKFGPNSAPQFKLLKSDLVTSNWMTQKYHDFRLVASQQAGLQEIPYTDSEPWYQEPDHCSGLQPDTEPVQKALIWRQTIDSSTRRLDYHLKPPVPLSAYDQQGRLQHVFYGLADNVGQVRDINLKIRSLSGDYRVSLNLRNELGDVYRFPMGTLKAGCWDILQWKDGTYYEKYETAFSKRPTINDQEIPYLIFDSLEIHTASHRRQAKLSVILHSITMRYLAYYTPSEKKLYETTHQQWPTAAYPDWITENRIYFSPRSWWARQDPNPKNTDDTSSEPFPLRVTWSTSRGRDIYAQHLDYFQKLISTNFEHQLLGDSPGPEHLFPPLVNTP